MDKVDTYRKLIVWEKSMELVEEVYGLVKLFPRDEIYNLTLQIKRCAVSIPSNIAEGRRRGSKKDYLKFLIISYSSGAELETQIEITKRLKFCDINNYKNIDRLLDEIMRMLNKMTRQLTNS